MRKIGRQLGQRHVVRGACWRVDNGMKVEERVVTGCVLIAGFGSLELVLGVQRRVQARGSHVFHVAAPSEAMRL